MCFGQGYVHGQDRLLQMHLKRILGKGRMSEFGGEKTLHFDQMMRQIGLHRVSEQIVQNLSAQSRACLQAYADGVNTYVDSIKVLPYEFSIIGTKWEKWEIIDTIISLKIMSFMVATDGMYELIRTETAKLVGEERAREYFGIGSENQFRNVQILDDEDLKQSSVYQKYEKVLNRPDVGEVFKNILLNLNKESGDSVTKMYGSNAWVISGNYTKSGKPLLANDPHLGTGMPCNWYQQELLYEVNGEKRYSVGVGMSGMPTLLIGRQDFFSMGVTVLMADIADYFYEEINTDNKTYKVGGKNRDLKVLQEQIKIKGQPTQNFDVYETHRGPVVSTVSSRRSGLIKTSYFSYCWTGKETNEDVFNTQVNRMKIKDQQGLNYGLYNFTSPGLTVPYATKNGDIGFTGIGIKPVRQNPRQGAFISDGRQSSDDWQGYMDPKEWPQVFNPKKGYIVNANNKFSTDNIKYGQSVNMFSTSRAYTIQNYIQDKISKNQKMSIDDMMELQKNVEDTYLKDVLPNLIKLFRKQRHKIMQSQEKIQVILEYLDKLQDWDYNITPDSVEATIASVWLNIFTNKIFIFLKESPEAREMLVNSIHLDCFLFKKLEEFGQNISQFDIQEEWCQTESEQNCLKVLFESLYDTKLFLDQNMGQDQRQGLLHRQLFPHPVFSKTPLKFIYDRYYRGFGNHRTLAVAIQDLAKKSFHSSFGANLRYVDDLSEGGKSYWIIDTGVSENIFSQYYDDQFKLHEKFEYIEMKYGHDRLNEYEMLLELIPRQDNL